MCTKYYVWNLCAVYVGKCAGGWLGWWVSDNGPGSNQYCVLFSKVDFSHIFTYGKLLNFNLDLNFQFKGDLTEFHHWNIIS